MLSSKQNVVMDLRSLSVKVNRFLRYVEDRLTIFELKQFSNLTIVSRSLAKKISRPSASVVSLGGEVAIEGILQGQNSFKKLKLVYVGSLDGRDLQFVIHSIASSKHCNRISLELIGNFQTSQGRALVELVQKLGLTDRITFRGYLKGSSLGKVLRSANLGIVHVPPSPFYRCQPSTKLYEYWAYGLPVLVSNYGFHEQDIPEGSGFVYEYKMESLQALFDQLTNSQNNFDYRLISDLARRHSWESVVNIQLLPVLKTLKS
jgi:glycosyltransferase involved in cell wall biosynthesis